MAYITISDLEEYYTETVLKNIASQHDDTDEYDTGKLNKAINKASSTIDSYIAGRYTVPISSPSTYLKLQCTYIAYKYLYDENYEIPESVKDNYNSAMQWLKDVAKGVAQIPEGEEGYEWSDMGVTYYPGADEDRTLDKWRKYR